MMAPLDRSLRPALANPWLLPALLLTLGLVARLLWLKIAHGPLYAGGEIANVAMAFARTGVLADSFQAHQGPTAHVLPIPPIFAGLIYRALGVRSFLSEAVLATAALALALTSFVVLYLSFQRMGSNRVGRLIGLGVLCLIPLNFSLEAVTFRIWEGLLATVLAASYLYALLLLTNRDVIRVGSMTLMSLLAAMLFFVNPPLGLSAYLCSVLFFLDRHRIRYLPVAGAIAAGALLLVVTPWAMRNYLVLGKPVLLRSDFGLELALANYPAAVSAANDADALRARLAEIHPFSSEAAFSAMRRAGGEVAYSSRLGADAMAWIGANPIAFAKLSVKHLGQYFFPPAWQWRIYSDVGRFNGSKETADLTIHALGIVGAIWALIRSPAKYRYAVLMIAVPALFYMILQPVLRYRYIMSGLIAYFAGDLIGSILLLSPSARRLLTRYGLEVEPAATV